MKFRPQRRHATLAGSLLLLAALIPSGPRAAGIPPPPGLLAMWEGRDGASVRAALRRYAAEGEQPGAAAGKRLEAGEAAWWLGVQDARAGRPDSALAQWRRAMSLRGDFDEGFALIDALFRRGRPADIAEAYGYAAVFAEQAQISMPRRAPDAQARLAWARHLRGRSDSALAGIREWCGGLRPRPQWTRRFALIELAAGDTTGAWRWLAAVSARSRRRDAEAESLLVRAQHALHYSDERRRITVALVHDAIETGERAFVASLGARGETLTARDGFAVRWITVPAAPGAPRATPMLFVLSPTDTLAAPDTLAAALSAAGHPVVLLAPRGSYGALGPGVMGPETWFGREAELHPLVAADAAAVMDLLAKRGLAPGGTWLVGAAGDMAPVALALARARGNRTKDGSGVQAMLLVAPRLPVVEVAEFRSRLRAARTRTFIQVSPEEPDALELADLIARATEPGQVRVADSGLHGRGAAIFRGDPRVAQRLLAWLAEKPAAR